MRLLLSVPLTSTLRFAEKLNPAPLVAVAILDRLLHHATVVNIKGKSYRMRRHQAQLEGERRGRL